MAVVSVKGERVVVELADGGLAVGGMVKRLPGLRLGGAPAAIAGRTYGTRSQRGPSLSRFVHDATPTKDGS